MRVTTLAWAIGAATIPVFSVFAGCGGTVTNASAGSGGAGGHAGTTATTSMAVAVGTTTAVATATSTSATTGSGGGGGGGGVGGSGTGTPDAGSPCDQACAHAASCGFDICSMFGISCATVSPMYDCILTCIDGVPCNDLQQGGFACYQMCQNMGTDGGGPPPFDAGPPPFDGGSTIACGQCLAQSCNKQAFACGKDTSPGGCLGWLECQGACYMANPVDPACFDNCDAMYPNAAPEYEPVYACACASCGTQCASGDPCSHVGDGGTGAGTGGAAADGG